MSRFAVLADIIVIVHFCYVAFTVGGEILILLGGALTWAWVRNLPFRVVHLAAVVLVAAEALAGTSCPLTVWEYALRARAGQAAEEQVSFVARLVRSIIFYDLPGVGVPCRVRRLCRPGRPDLCGHCPPFTFLFVRYGPMPLKKSRTTDPRQDHVAQEHQRDPAGSQHHSSRAPCGGEQAVDNGDVENAACAAH